MSTYRTVIRMTDSGPYIIKLILNLGCEVGQNDLSPEVFNVHVIRREKNGDVLMRTEHGAEVALPSVGYVTVKAAYPCDENGSFLPRGSYAALELLEERLNKKIEGSVLSSRYVQNCFRVTQLKPFPPLEADKPATTGLVFDTFDGDISPELNSWQNDESTLKYGWFTPKHEAGQKLPLIIWLHGAGEGGNDPLVAYTGNRVTALSSPKVQRELGGAAWVLVPQCPTVWMDDGKEQLGRSNQSIYSKPLKACIDQFIAEHVDEVDTSRIWITGISNGGFMTVRMVLDYPGFFAAAAPGCTPFFEENITDEVVDTLKKTPIWFTHAKNDELVHPEETVLPLYRCLHDAGAENLHFTYWEEVLDPTGEYKDEHGRPKRYMNHGVWVLMLDDVCRADVDGRAVLCDGVPCTIWEWMGKQHL